jgi:hypothetical protein
MPDMLRVDNGAPWGSWNDLPPQLALWVIGLGIEMHWNTPCRPQENGVIERSQGLATRWAEPKNCHTLPQFQKRVDHEDKLQRERLRLANGQSRMNAFPELKKPRRGYNYRWEQRHWDWAAVRQHLSTYVITRQVDCSGKIGLAGWKLYVGTVRKGQPVLVQFDPDQIAWIICKPDGELVRCIPARMTPKGIRTLKMQISHQ